MTICYRPTALAQLDGIFDYIAQHNPKSADKVLRTIQRSIDRLADFPLSGLPSRA